MANSEQLEILKQGVEVWNEWTVRNPDIEPDLSEAQLEHTDFNDINFHDANLRGAALFHSLFANANFEHADLSEAILNGSIFTGANLKSANLGKSHIYFSSFMVANLQNVNLEAAVLLDDKFQTTDLDRTDFTGASLHRLDFNRVFLNRAKFSRAELAMTIFGNVDLSTAKGLETVVHIGPSTIGIDTIYKSRGEIPEIFLRGCGVPETFIVYARSLVGQPIRFFSCFISHSHHDQRFCDRLYADLQARNIRVWYFPEDAKWGESVWGEIDRSIKIYDKLVIVCSKHSLTSSPALREIERALGREDKEEKNVLFPITVDDHVFESWSHPRKADLLAKVVGDFRGWNRNASKYDAALKKLLKALEVDG